MNNFVKSDRFELSECEIKARRELCDQKSLRAYEIDRRR